MSRVRSMTKFTRSLYFAAFIALFVTACAATMPKESEEIPIEMNTFTKGVLTYPYDLFTEYKILPGDILDVLFQVQTWVPRDDYKFGIDDIVSIKFVHAKELDQEQTIRPDGKISLPYLGEMYIVGKNIEELTAELTSSYTGILRKPELYIVVPEFRASIKELKKDLHTAPRGLSRLVTVRPDGYVTFPMVGDIFVVGKTIPDINKLLNERYIQIIPELHVDLFLEKHAGALIYVVGKVNKPGPYNIVKPITIMEALSLAGSYSHGAKLDSIIIVRKYEGKMVATRVDLDKTMKFETKSSLFYLQPDDIMYVPETRISKAADVARDIADIIFYRGWSGPNFSWELHDAKPGNFNP
ncbi:MAG: polysaccharide biosynthesis/export family protein [Deltaproteobacteria bacterium]|nr:polysaccharide biosynthesis/export family protein [Deltaproteobacteria bacterium]